MLLLGPKTPIRLGGKISTNLWPEIEHNLRLEQKIFPPNLPIANLGLQQIDSPFGPHCDEMARFKI